MFKDNFITICRAHHLALTTERSYWGSVRQFILWTKAKSAAELEANATDKFRQYLTAMANENEDREYGNEGVSASTQNLAFHAIRFLYEKVIGVPLGDLSNIPRATGHERIVDVPPMEDAMRIVKSVSGKTGTALRLILGTAGRLHDILRIRVKDLDFRRKLVAIQESKGGKSRLVPMPETLIPELKQLVREREKIHEYDLREGFGWVHMPGKLAAKYPNEQTSLGWQYVFCGADRSKDPYTGNIGRTHLQAETLQRAFLLARKKLNIRRHYTIHGMRHATAQHWEANGATRSQIQTLLGHTNGSTTDRYLLSGIKGLPKVIGPL